MRLAVLASGTGSIYEAIVNAGISVATVLVDRPCKAIDLAESESIPVTAVMRTEFGKDFDRNAYSTEIVTQLQRQEIDVIAMAGFGTVLGLSLIHI